MKYIHLKERANLEEFREVIYLHIRENNLKYSDQREKVLKMLYTQSLPISTKKLVEKLNNSNINIGYTTVSRHLIFFTKLDLLIVTKKSEKKFLLKESL